MTDKKQIREYYKALRNAMLPELAKQLSVQISDYILQWELYQKADTIFFYYPLGKEVSLLHVAEDALSRGKCVAFPKADDKQMEFHRVNSLSEFKEGSFHVMEPFAEGKHPVSAEPSLCFVPGTVFDREGGRFGYGKGYYDRYFADTGSTKLVGCAYECQIVTKLPVDVWDRKMDYLVSENGLYSAAADTMT